MERKEEREVKAATADADKVNKYRQETRYRVHFHRFLVLANLLSPSSVCRVLTAFVTCTGAMTTKLCRQRTSRSRRLLKPIANR